MGLTQNDKKLEDLLNEHARQGWRLDQFAENLSKVILVRDRNT